MWISIAIIIHIMLHVKSFLFSQRWIPQAHQHYVKLFTSWCPSGQVVKIERGPCCPRMWIWTNLMLNCFHITADFTQVEWESQLPERFPLLPMAVQLPHVSRHTLILTSQFEVSEILLKTQKKWCQRSIWVLTKIEAQANLNVNVNVKERSYG